MGFLSFPVQSIPVESIRSEISLTSNLNPHTPQF